MHVVYAPEALPKSWTSAIFLAGPTPRGNKETGIMTAMSWRPEALAYLESIGYDGVVFVPEDRDGVMRHSYDDQVEWEETCLNTADIIIFWVPRDLSMVTLDPKQPKKQTLAMPALTTNVEYGVWITRDPARVVFGAPREGQKNTYLQYYAEKYHVPVCDSLEATCDAALAKIGDTHSITRSDGERFVPLHIWRTQAFQSWYENLVTAGNRLESARVEWVFRVGPEKQFLLFWTLHVDIYVTQEDRHKSNEVVTGRPDTSMIMLYERGEDILDTRIVLIKEFRSPASNEEGYVYELVGGSSWKPGQNPLHVAVDECEEEAGVQLSEDHFVVHEVRQLSATSLTNRAHLFSAALSTEEMDVIAESEHVVRGVAADTERTWAQVWVYDDILHSPHIDWSTLGMIAAVLNET